MASPRRYILFVLLAVTVMTSLAVAKKSPRCERVKISFCQGLGYNMTIFPNNLDHDTQDEAKQATKELSNLVETECSPDLAYFLCSLYAPVCTVMQTALPPCRSLCENARSGCEQIMNTAGFVWPQRFQCTNFPKQGLCVGRNVTSSNQPSKKSTSGKKKVSVHKLRRKRCSKQSAEAKFCCKLGRRAVKKSYSCTLRKRSTKESKRYIRFRDMVIKHCHRYSACFRSCCEVFQRKRRSSKRNAKKSSKE